MLTAFVPGQIFTEDLIEVENLPRDKVLHFLLEGFKELAIPYLEHIVYVWEDKSPEFHNVLIRLYLQRVQSLMKQYLNSLPEGMALERSRSHFSGSEYNGPITVGVHREGASMALWLVRSCLVAFANVTRVSICRSSFVHFKR